MEDYVNCIDEDLWRLIETEPYRVDLVQAVGKVGVDEDIIVQENKMKGNDKRCLRELRGALAPIVYNYVCGFKTAKLIWDTLYEKYQGKESTKKSSMSKCLSKLEGF